MDGAATASGLAMLEASGFSGHLAAALAQLADQQPPDPLAFLAAYFQRAVQPAGALADAAHWLRAAPLGQPAAFREAAARAYLALADDAEEGRVAGGQVRRLLKLLCAECHPDAAAALRQELVGGEEAGEVSLRHFTLAARAALLFQQVAAHCGALCAAAPAGQGSDQVTRGTVSRLLSQLGVQDSPTPRGAGGSRALQAAEAVLRARDPGAPVSSRQLVEVVLYALAVRGRT